MNYKSAFLLRCPAIPKVRIALVGLGNRGTKTLVRYAFIGNAEISCIVDVDSRRLERANKLLRDSGRKEALALCGPDAWKEACQLPDIDLIYICTEWRTHTLMAVHAMRCGKHVAVEVPAATTVEECWSLVHTAEQTQRHCFMTENCCYDYFALETLEMHRRGLFGEITHCEGAYIHDLSTDNECGESNTSWIERGCLTHGGNPYPTHGIGPIGQLLGFHRTDRMLRLVSMTSAGAKEAGLPLGRVNTTLIQTARGVSIMLQLDVTTHRPYNRLQTVCGTKAFVQKYPVPTVNNGEQCFTGDSAERYMSRFDGTDAAQLLRKGEAMNVPNAMNYAMDARLIHCLNNGLPLDIDVYDAAEWSCLTELSRLSAQNGCTPIEIPEFCPNMGRK